MNYLVLLVLEQVKATQLLLWRKQDTMRLREKIAATVVFYVSLYTGARIFGAFQIQDGGVFFVRIPRCLYGEAEHF